MYEGNNKRKKKYTMHLFYIMSIRESEHSIIFLITEMGVSNETKSVIPLKFLRKIKKKISPLVGKLNPGTYSISDPESPPNKTIIFTKYRERHYVVVFPQVLLTIKVLV
jgi:hypothetical protein